MLSIEQLTYQYNDAKSNNHQYRYSLSMQSGECCAIVGKSGSGKSTLLELIAGFLPPSSGEIIFHHQSIQHLPADKRPLSILFQESNVFNHLTVYQNIAIGLSETNGIGLSLSKSQQHAIDSALNDANLMEFKHRLPESLSGGQRQRVGLLRCLLREKPILLLDEPFSGLNQELKADFKQWIKQYMNHHQAYVIWVTHDISDVEGIASQVYVMNNHCLTPK